MTTSSSRKDAGISGTAGAIATFSSWLDKDAKLQDTVFPVAHPINRGLDGTSGRIAGKDGDSWFHLKVLNDDLIPWIDFADASALAEAAGLADIAPRLRASDAATGAFLFDDISGDWRYAMVHEFREADIRVKTIQATKKLHALNPLEHTYSIFQRIDDLRRQLEKLTTDAIASNGGNMPLPENYLTMSDWVGRIAQAFKASGFDLTPCHVENSLSNVMLGPSHEVKLVDFDRAANADPLADIGALCNEYCRTENDISEAMEIYIGRPEKSAIARVKLHMIASAFYWGLWAVVSHFRSPHGEVEIFKYGSNQLIRCAANISRWDVDVLVRDM